MTILTVSLRTEIAVRFSAKFATFHFSAVSDPFWRFQTRFGGFRTILAVLERTEIAVQFSAKFATFHLSAVSHLFW